MARPARIITIALTTLVALALGTYVAAQWTTEREANPAPITGDIDASTFRNIAMEQTPMVVSIRTITEQQPSPRDFPARDFFRQFFDMPGLVGPNAPPRIMEGAGSGFIIDPAGLILTNHHVVADAQRIEVALFPDPEANPDDVRRYTATVLGRDPMTDSALLQLTDAPSLPVARLGNSDAVRPGDWAVAIGNPFALSHTVTVGVISATSRPFPVEGRLQRVLQTDAAVNPGNSGGPLLNLRGEVIGITTAIFTGGTGANVGVGFAVPINLVRDLLPELRKGDFRRGRLGVEIRGIPSAAREALGAPAEGGVLVASVEPGGPAARAGLRPGDVLLRVNDEAIDSTDELVQMISGMAPGTEVALIVVRDKAEQTIRARLDELTTAGRTSESGSQTPEGLGLTLSAAEPGRGAQATPGQVVITDVRRASPAAEAGLRPGDVLLEINRAPVKSVDDAAERLRSAPADSAIFLLISRDNRRMFMVLGKP